MEIALCDDRVEELEQLARMIRDYFAARPDLDGGVRTFHSPYDLIECVRSRGGFDGYLLDVLMPHMDGIQLGRAIRDAGDKAPIVYLTVSPDFALDSFQVRALDYLLKPVAARRLEAVLDELADTARQGRERPLPVRTAGGVTPVYPGELCYVQAREHILYYHLSGGQVVKSVTQRQGFDQSVAPLLEDARFLKIGASAAVNIGYVRSLSGGTFWMTDGAALKVSRSLLRPVREAYMERIVERGRTPRAGT